MEDIINANNNTIQIFNSQQMVQNNFGGLSCDPNKNYLLEIKQKLLINIEMKLRSLDDDKSAMILLDNFHILFLNNNDLFCKIPLEIVQSILKLIQRTK